MKAIAALTLALLAATPLSAWALEKPKGEIVLTVTGTVANANTPEGTAAFDMDMLEALKGRTGTMQTPWTEGKTAFSGPFVRSILDAAGAKGSRLVVKALNDYSAEIPSADATRLDTILATRMNGELMSVRDKGPLFLIYPFDLDQDLYNEKYFSRSVWQIKEIEVVK